MPFGLLNIRMLFSLNMIFEFLCVYEGQKEGERGAPASRLCEENINARAPAMVKTGERVSWIVALWLVGLDLVDSYC